MRLNVILAAICTPLPRLGNLLMSSPVPSSPASATPAMRQYFDAKRQYRDAILFFRMGDFYEMFYEDALTAARALELTLTSRSKDANGGAIPMCGVPHHAADGYIARLVRKGFRVAVCEQMEDPRKAKGVVKREVVRVLSPGTLTDAGYLDAREPAFLMALAPATTVPTAATARRCSTCRPANSRPPSIAGRTGRAALADELAVLRPREIIAPAGFDDAQALIDELRLSARLTAADGWTFDLESARRTLLAQLRTHSLQGFGLEEHAAAISCRRRPRAVPEGHAESRSRPRPRDQLSKRRRLPDPRPDHAAQSRDRRSRRRRRDAVRCCTKSIAR